MELDIKIDLPEDFRMLCEIFSIQPQSIVQLIVNQISFPHFYTHSNDKGKWATLILLDYLDDEDHLDEKEREFTEYYLENIKETDSAKAEDAAREIIREWHKAVSKERAKYLLDNLPSEE
jgi:hypothetical protein